MVHPAWFGTNVTTDTAGNAFPPIPAPPEADPNPSYPADEVIHLMRGLRDLWLPPTWSQWFFAPHALSPYVVPENWRFERQGEWFIRRIALFPFNRRVVGQAYTAATYPSQVMVSISAGDNPPFVLDATHWDMKDLNLRCLNGTFIQVESADTTNDGVVYIEFAEVVHY